MTNIELLYLASQSRELEYVDGFVKHGGIVGHIHKHGYLALSKGLPLSTPHKVVLKEPSEFALSERHHPLFSTSAMNTQQKLCEVHV